MSDAQVSKTAPQPDKGPIEHETAGGDVEFGSCAVKDIRNVDEALEFTGNGAEEIHYSEEEERAVLRKIDWNIIPLLCWVYMIQFADKTSLNYASLMGIREDANLDPNSQQFPTTYLLRRLPLGKYTSVNIFLWGAILTCHAAAHSYSALMAVRFFLGAFEATITPAFVLFTSIWYKKNEQAQRIGYWLSCNGIALLIMGPIAYGLSGVKNAALPAWEILFLMLGLLTVVTGAVAFFLMPDNQTNAAFLSLREKRIAVDRIRGNHQGIGNRVWKWDQFREALRDVRTWLYVLFSLLMNIPNGGITTFGSIVIKSFGVDDRMALLLNMPTGVVDISAKLLFPWISDRLLDRSLPAFVAILIPMVGGIMMIVIPLTHKAALLVGYYFIGAAGASWCLVMAMISTNTLGFTKKATVNGLQILAYAAGNWIGPQTFRSNDAPDYYYGKLMVAIMYGLAAITLLIIRFVNVMENRRRDKAAAELDMDASDEADNEFADLTDFQQKNFRYVI
ncbi:MFS allantoate transporter [Lasiodiplodia theobromae]|uniref:Putative transporter n=1 Tax=Lasiodiplodia theobromae TaxID=45133 RepID=A0A5N5D681_9PEZI|nr:MFS allantoate transporter [Lasiodiplodia theobromae]KAB2573268.1 putative transporter [Lasiodiplodia theobromae]KAF4543358.1 MFS allantoate transporter [Lasiodiplodia theobromae]